MPVADVPTTDYKFPYYIVKEYEQPVSVSGSSQFIDAQNFYNLVKEKEKERSFATYEDITLSWSEESKNFFALISQTSNYLDLKAKANHEYKNHADYIKINSQSFYEISDYLIKNIASLNYEKGLVELSPLNEIKFKIKLNDKVFLIVSKPLELLENDNYKTVTFSMFINKECVLSDYIEIEDLTKAINKFSLIR